MTASLRQWFLTPEPPLDATIERGWLKIRVAIAIGTFFIKPNRLLPVVQYLLQEASVGRRCGPDVLRQGRFF